MPPYSFLNGLWIGGKHDKTPPSSNRPSTQLDKPASDQGEAYFMTGDSQQDYEGRETRQIGIEPERMDRSQMFDSVIEVTNGGGTASREVNAFDNHHAGEMQNFGQVRGSIAANHNLEPADQSMDGVVPGGVASLYVESEDEDEEVQPPASRMQSFGVGPHFHPSHEFVSRVESREASSANHDFQYHGGQMQQPNNHMNHTDTSRLLSFPDHSTGEARPGEATYIKQEHEPEQGMLLEHDYQPSMINAQIMARLQGMPYTGLRPHITGSVYSPRMSTNGAPSGRSRANISDNRLLAQGAHRAHHAPADASQRAMYGQHGINSPRPRFYQGAQNTGHGYGVPSQRGISSQQDLKRPSSNDLFCTPDPRTAASHQPRKAAKLAPGTYPSGHAHIAQSINRSSPSQEDVESAFTNSCESSDEEPLLNRIRHNATTVSTGSTPTPGPQTTAQVGNNNAPTSSPKPPAVNIDFKLPRHEATYEKDDLGYAIAKVSLPGLVREAVVLSADHSEHEYQLFVDVFLPSHLALATPDPQPAIAVLNFHTIASIVLSTYNLLVVQEGVKLQDLDTDEVFFQVLDRWRVGVLTDKESYKLVRGIQEFVDLALDLVFWVKEHGMWQPPEPEKKERSERCDKGVKRGSKEAVDEVMGAKKVTELQARKKEKMKEPMKAKAKPLPKPKSKPGPKSKGKPGRPPGRPKKDFGGISVTKKGRVEKRKK